MNIEIISDFDLSCALIASVLHNLIVVNLPSHHIMSNNFRTLTHLEKIWLCTRVQNTLETNLSDA